MAEPTDKHREEAREIVQSQILEWHTAGDAEPSPLDVHRIINTESLIDRIASALSARDWEIREVLEGLAARDDDGFCWCPPRYELEPHTPACLAARGLWERVQS